MKPNQYRGLCFETEVKFTYWLLTKKGTFNETSAHCYTRVTTTTNLCGVCLKMRRCYRLQFVSGTVYKFFLSIICISAKIVCTSCFARDGESSC